MSFHEFAFLSFFSKCSSTGALGVFATKNYLYKQSGSGSQVLTTFKRICEAETQHQNEVLQLREKDLPGLKEKHYSVSVADYQNINQIKNP